MAKSETLAGSSLKRADGERSGNCIKKQSSPPMFPRKADNNFVASLDFDGFNVLFEETKNPILIFQDDRVVYINKKGSEKFGYTTEETIGKTVEFIFRKRLVKSSYQVALSAYYDTSEVFPAITFIAKSGESILVQPQVVVIEYNHKPAYLIIMRDLREQAISQEQSSQDLASLSAAINQTSGELRNILQSVANAQYYIKKEFKSTEPHFKNSRNIKNMLEVVDSAVSRADKLLRNLMEIQESKTKTPDLESNK
jgi:PAS domain S-box-containing protein